MLEARFTTLRDRLQFAQTANPALLRELFKSCSGFYLIAVLLYFGTLHWQHGFLLDLHQFIVGLDCVNLWFTGKLAFYANPGQYYQSDLYMQALNRVLGFDYEPHFLSYPPTEFLFGLPFGLLPYYVAYPVWIALNAVALFFSVRSFSKHPLFLLVLFSPAALIWLICGQSSLLTTALLISALRWLDRAPRKAGICIGLLIIKPQLALLFPLFLLLTQRWQTFLYASLTLGLILGLTLACFGLAPWIAYWHTGISEVTDVFIHTTDMVTSLSPTLFNDLRLFGASPAVAFGFQTLVTCAVVACFAVAIRRKDAPAYTMLLFILTTNLATCYLLSYDLVPFTFVLLYVACTVPLTRHERILFAACFWLPLLVFFVKAMGIPGPSFLPLYLLAYLLLGPLCRLRSAPSGATPLA